jgi:lysophospholipase L1-like esterase
MDEGAQPAPDWLIDTHTGAGGAAAARRLQETYNDIVRQVGRATSTPVADLETAFQNMGKDRLFAYPGGDFIHPNDRGYSLIAGGLYLTLVGLAASR